MQLVKWAAAGLAVLAGAYIIVGLQPSIDALFRAHPESITSQSVRRWRSRLSCEIFVFASLAWAGFAHWPVLSDLTDIAAWLAVAVSFGLLVVLIAQVNLRMTIRWLWSHRVTDTSPE
jgi:hypothetical protein